jgi:hypothetical protein
MPEFANGRNRFSIPMLFALMMTLGADFMNRRILAYTAILTLFVGSEVLAQSVSVVVEPEQRTRIKEYVVKEKVPRVAVKERIRVGAPVPTDVELRTVPEDWGPSVRRYRYYHSDAGIHFVDPESRRVVYDID